MADVDWKLEALDGLFALIGREIDRCWRLSNHAGFSWESIRETLGNFERHLDGLRDKRRTIKDLPAITETEAEAEQLIERVKRYQKEAHADARFRETLRGIRSMVSGPSIETSWRPVPQYTRDPHLLHHRGGLDGDRVTTRPHLSDKR